METIEDILKDNGITAADAKDFFEDRFGIAMKPEHLQMTIEEVESSIRDNTKVDAPTVQETQPRVSYQPPLGVFEGGGGSDETLIPAGASDDEVAKLTDPYKVVGKDKQFGFADIWNPMRLVRWASIPAGVVVGGVMEPLSELSKRLGIGSELKLLDEKLEIATEAGDTKLVAQLTERVRSLIGLGDPPGEDEDEPLVEEPSNPLGAFGENEWLQERLKKEGSFLDTYEAVDADINKKWSEAELLSLDLPYDWLLDTKDNVVGLAELLFQVATLSPDVEERTLMGQLAQGFDFGRAAGGGMAGLPAALIANHGKSVSTKPISTLLVIGPMLHTILKNPKLSPAAKKTASMMKAAYDKIPQSIKDGVKSGTAAAARGTRSLRQMTSDKFHVAEGAPERARARQIIDEPATVRETIKHETKLASGEIRGGKVELKAVPEEQRATVEDISELGEQRRRLAEEKGEVPKTARPPEGRRRAVRISEEGDVVRQSPSEGRGIVDLTLARRAALESEQRAFDVLDLVIETEAGLEGYTATAEVADIPRLSKTLELMQIAEEASKKKVQQTAGMADAWQGFISLIEPGLLEHLPKVEVAELLEVVFEEIKSFEDGTHPLMVNPPGGGGKPAIKATKILIPEFNEIVAEAKALLESGDVDGAVEVFKRLRDIMIEKDVGLRAAIAKVVDNPAETASRINILEDKLILLEAEAELASTASGMMEGSDSVGKTVAEFKAQKATSDVEDLTAAAKETVYGERFEAEPQVIDTTSTAFNDFAGEIIRILDRAYPRDWIRGLIDDASVPESVRTLASEGEGGQRALSSSRIALRMTQVLRDIAPVLLKDESFLKMFLEEVGAKNMSKAQRKALVRELQRIAEEQNFGGEYRQTFDTPVGRFTLEGVLKTIQSRLKKENPKRYKEIQANVLEQVGSQMAEDAYRMGLSKSLSDEVFRFFKPEEGQILATADIALNLASDLVALERQPFPLALPKNPAEIIATLRANRAKLLDAVQKGKKTPKEVMAEFLAGVEGAFSEGIAKVDLTEFIKRTDELIKHLEGWEQITIESGGSNQLFLGILKQQNLEHIFVPKRLARLIRYTTELTQSRDGVQSLIMRLQSMMKSGLTSFRLAGHKHNIMGNFINDILFYGGDVRKVTGDVMDAARTIRDIHTGKIKDPAQRRMLRYLAKRGVFESSLVEGEALRGLEALFDRKVPVVSKAQNAMLKAYNLEDAYFKLAEGKRQYEYFMDTINQITQDVRAASADGRSLPIGERIVSFRTREGQYLNILLDAATELGSNELGHFDIVMSDVPFSGMAEADILSMMGKASKRNTWTTVEGRNAVEKMADLASMYAAHKTFGRFFNYTDNPLFVDWMKRQPIVGVASPFFTFFAHAVDAPGKKGVVRNILFSDNFEISTGNKRVQSKITADNAKYSERRAALAATGMAEAMADKHKRDQIYRWSPGQMGLFVVANQAEGGVMYRNTRSLVAMSATLEAASTVLWGMAKIGEALGMDRDPAHSDFSRAMAGGGVADWTMVAELAGLGKNPLAETFDKLKEEERAGRWAMRQAVKLGLTTAFGGSVQTAIEIGASLWDPTSLLTSETYRIKGPGKETMDFWVWATYKMFGAGFKSASMEGKVDKYLTTYIAKARFGLVKALDEELDRLESALETGEISQEEYNEKYEATELEMEAKEEIIDQMVERFEEEYDREVQAYKRARKNKKGNSPK